MSTVSIAGFVLNGMVYVNTTVQSMHLLAPYNPEAGFDKLGWWFPNDGQEKITEVLVSGNDAERHEDVTYSGSVLRHDGQFYDVKLAGPNYRLMFVHQPAPVMVFPADRESTFVATFIEHLSTHPDLDTEGPVWSVDRIVKILSCFAGSHNFKPFMPLDELKAKVHAMPECKLAPFPRQRKSDYERVDL